MNQVFEIIMDNQSAFGLNVHAQDFFCQKKRERFNIHAPVFVPSNTKQKMDVLVLDPVSERFYDQLLGFSHGVVSPRRGIITFEPRLDDVTRRFYDRLLG